MKLILLTSLIFISSINLAVANTKTRISGYDNILTSDKEITLLAKLESVLVFPFRPDIEDAKINFFKGEKLLGSAITNNKGDAVLKISNPGNGTFFYKTTYAGSSKYRKSQGEITITVADPSTPILISDIDHTISDASSVNVLLKHNSKIPQLKDADKILTDLAKEYQIVYLTARDDTFLTKTKDWFTYFSFPKAPIFFRGYNSKWSEASDHGLYKTLLIKKLRESFHNILIGVGDKPHDIKAYLENGLRAFYIGKEDRDIIPNEASIVDSWYEIQDQI
jgi:hypothetical protein